MLLFGLLRTGLSLVTVVLLFQTVVLLTELSFKCKTSFQFVTFSVLVATSLL